MSTLFSPLPGKGGSEGPVKGPGAGRSCLAHGRPVFFVIRVGRIRPEHLAAFYPLCVCDPACFDERNSGRFQSSFYCRQLVWCRFAPPLLEVTHGRKGNAGFGRKFFLRPIQPCPCSPTLFRQPWVLSRAPEANKGDKTYGELPNLGRDHNLLREKIVLLEFCHWPIEILFAPPSADPIKSLREVAHLLPFLCPHLQKSKPPIGLA